jgi:hypothetical protein
MEMNRSDPNIGVVLELSPLNLSSGNSGITGFTIESITAGKVKIGSLKDWHHRP